MGIFSFLTGKKEDGTAGEASAGLKSATTSDVSPLADVRAGSSPPDTANVAPASGPSSAGTPFTPPDAWNIDALTAPKPEQTSDKPEVGQVDAADFQILYRRKG